MATTQPEAETITWRGSAVPAAAVRQVLDAAKAWESRPFGDDDTEAGRLLEALEQLELYT